MSTSSIFADRLRKIKNGQSNYGNPATLGPPGDRGPSLPVPVQPPVLKLSMSARKRKLNTYA